MGLGFRAGFGSIRLPLKGSIGFRASGLGFWVLVVLGLVVFGFACCFVGFGVFSI